MKLLQKEETNSSKWARPQQSMPANSHCMFLNISARLGVELVCKYLKLTLPLLLLLNLRYYYNATRAQFTCADLMILIVRRREETKLGITTSLHIPTVYYV